MRYAREVIDLMAAYPGRKWRMHELVRHVAGGRPPGRLHRNRYRQGISRVLHALAEARAIEYRWSKRGSPGVYCWGSCDEEKCNIEKVRASSQSA
jgi:hypothetical protein